MLETQCNCAGASMHNILSVLKGRDCKHGSDELFKISLLGFGVG